MRPATGSVLYHIDMTLKQTPATLEESSGCSTEEVLTTFCLYCSAGGEVGLGARARALRAYGKRDLVLLGFDFAQRYHQAEPHKLAGTREDYVL